MRPAQSEAQVAREHTALLYGMRHRRFPGPRYAAAAFGFQEVRTIESVRGRSTKKHATRQATTAALPNAAVFTKVPSLRHLASLYSPIRRPRHVAAIQG